MKKILDTEETIKISKKLQEENKKIVLAGGCFDILHKGHQDFLQAAKDQGDILIVLLESDESIKKQKGETRPHNSSDSRIKQLLALPSVDYVLPLTGALTDQEYDSLVSSIKPAIIATTKGDPYRDHKERQARVTGAIVKDVIERYPDYSSTLLLEQQKL